MKSNVEFDETGGVLFDDEGEILLKDENDVGVLAKTHVIPLSQLDEKGQILAGFIARCEIYWDLRRSPSPDMVDPSDLVWLSIMEDDSDPDDSDPTDGGEEVEVDEFEEAS